jgi:small ligand-binding sensory domain FIST
VKCAVVTTTTPDIVSALDGLCDRLASDLEGARPDLLVAFFTPHHSGDAPTLRRKIVDRLDPAVLMGCPGAGVIGSHEEVEGRTGLTLWGAAWPGADIVPFRIEVDGDEGDPTLVGWPERVPDDAGFVVLADPYTTPGDTLLAGFGERHPGASVVGGMASGTQGPGQAMFVTNDGVLEEGAIAVAIGGTVQMDPVVSQGCRPVGHHFVITKAQQNVILSLGGKPALGQLRTVFNAVDKSDRTLMQNALHIGRVVDERKSSFERGDLLVRNLLGIDPRNEALAINDFVRPGQSIQFMVRDSAAASEDLSLLLSAESRRGPVLGAMLFSCNGRGKQFFGSPNHDIAALHREVGDVPTAGFFANGEIGPVGGQPFLHGYTASIALFRRRLD